MDASFWPVLVAGHHQDRIFALSEQAVDIIGGLTSSHRLKTSFGRSLQY